MKRHILFLLVCIFLCNHTQAQTSPKGNIDKVYYKLAADYMETVKNASNLFYGKIHIPYLRRLKEPYLPYLSENSGENTGTKQNLKIHDFYSKGRLCYGKAIYPEVYLLLDLFKNELIVFSPDKLYNIILDPEKVESAEVQGYHVIYLKPDGLKNCPEKGYYLKLYSGVYAFLKKESYIIIEKKAELFLKHKIKYFIIKDKEYFTVKSKRSILNTFKSHKKELNEFIKKNNLKFDDHNRESSIVQVVKQYESLLKK